MDINSLIGWLKHNDGEFLCLMVYKGVEGVGDWLSHLHRHSQISLGMKAWKIRLCLLCQHLYKGRRGRIKDQVTQVAGLEMEESSTTLIDTIAEI